MRIEVESKCVDSEYATPRLYVVRSLSNLCVHRIDGDDTLGTEGYVSMRAVRYNISACVHAPCLDRIPFSYSTTVSFCVMFNVVYLKICAMLLAVRCAAESARDVQCCHNQYVLAPAMCFSSMTPRWLTPRLQRRSVAAGSCRTRLARVDCAFAYVVHLLASRYAAAGGARRSRNTRSAKAMSLESCRVEDQGADRHWCWYSPAKR
jgi:hypothetical protein